MKKRTLANLYLQAKGEPTPARAFLMRVAEITHKSELTAKNWVRGICEPDELSKTTLANHLGIPADELFPPITKP